MKNFNRLRIVFINDIYTLDIDAKIQTIEHIKRIIANKNLDDLFTFLDRNKKEYVKINYLNLEDKELDSIINCQKDFLNYISKKF